MPLLLQMPGRRPYLLIFAVLTLLSQELGTAWAAAPKYVRDQIESWLNQAQNQYSQKNYTDASETMRNCNEMLDDFGDLQVVYLAKTHALWAQALEGEGKRSEAAGHWKVAFSREKNQEFLVNAASDYASAGMNKEALDLYAQLIKEFGDGFYANRGDCYKAMKDYDKALSDYERALKALPAGALRDAVEKKELEVATLIKKGTPELDSGHASQSSAVAHGSPTQLISQPGVRPSGSSVGAEGARPQHPPTKASTGPSLEMLNSILQLNPRDPGAYLERAKQYLKANLFVQAIRDASMTISLDPKNSEAYALRAEALAAQQKPGQAMSDASAALGMDPHNQKALLASARACLQTNSVAMAMNLLVRARDINPNDPEYMLLQAQCSLMTHDEHESIAMLDQYLRSYPSDANAYALRGEANFALKQYKEAVADFNRSLRIDPRSAAVKQYLESAKRLLPSGQ